MIYYTFGSNSTLLYAPSFTEATNSFAPASAVKNSDGTKPRLSCVDIYYEGEQMGRSISVDSPLFGQRKSDLSFMKGDLEK